MALHLGLASAFLLGLRSHEAHQQPDAGAVYVDLISIPVLHSIPQADVAPPPRAPTFQLRAPEVPPMLTAAEPEILIDIRDEPTDAVAPTQPQAQLQPQPPSPVEPPQTATLHGNVAEPSAAEQVWEGLVLAALERKKHYPAAAQWRGHEDVVYLRIVIDRAGNVLDVRVERSMGIRALDVEAVAIARRSSPLPVPPESVSGERIELVVPIEFFIRRSR